ncbi:MAG: MurT ligase domain-containing protein [Clostridia bacterium]|nr:MurT ligase domain-containing protein [Clostridia bacterium]
MDYIVILLTKLLGKVTALLGGGTNLPGEIALKLRPQILKKLSMGYQIVLVTGTNGKTTTVSMLQSILRRTGKRAIGSTSGANLKSGVATCLIQNFPLLHKVKGDYAVLEVDEAYMRHVTEDIKPAVIAVTNIFRDQLDRYGEIDITLSLIEEACKKSPDTTLVLNGDEAMLGDFVPENKHFYYGFNTALDAAHHSATNVEGKHCKKCKTPYAYDFVTFNHLGAYCCPKCGFKRPALSLAVEEITEITADSSSVKAGLLTLTIPQAGVYNIYNALCAAACARVLGMQDEDIREGIAGQACKFGRQETVPIKNALLRIILIKNPAGAEQAIASVLPDKTPVYLGVMLNDRYADGTDVSWIYDVEFEKLRSMQAKGLLIGGTRAYDMGIRMKVAGFEKPEIHLTYEEMLTAIEGIEGRIYMFMTYTAMTGFRKFLYNKKYIKKLWF